MPALGKTPRQDTTFPAADIKKASKKEPKMTLSGIFKETGGHVRIELPPARKLT